MNLDEMDRIARRVTLHGSLGDRENGMFVVPRGPCGVELGVLAATGEGWEHVSVSTPRRIPNWTEMEWIKRRTLGDVVAFQLHLPESDHVNINPYTLHIWRPLELEIPLPPKWMV